jgi:hypothetical protein
MCRGEACFSLYQKHSFEPIRCLVLGLEANMRRQDFLGVVGGGAVAWPLGAQAQQPKRVRRIGLLAGSAGGGFPDNIPRGLADSVAVRIDLSRRPVLPGDTPVTLAARVYIVEDRSYPLAPKRLTEGQGTIDGDHSRIERVDDAERFLNWRDR